MNLWNRHGDWARRRTVLIEGLRRLGPDIVAFQEAVVTDDYDQVADLLGAGYHVRHQAGREADGSGCSVASRWPVHRHEERHLRVTDRVDPAELTGRLACAEIDVPAPLGPVLLVHHKPSPWLGFEYERELQAVATARYVEERHRRRPAHVVLLGDFDAEPESAGLRFLTGRQSLDGCSVAYRDAWAPRLGGDTFSPVNPLVTGGNWPLEQGRRIDYILVRCGRHGPTLRIASCERVFAEPSDGVWASDHFGVTAELAVLEGP
jgi:endonuclease/exonuclease/phosphatase family metal-dependent hydrolase